MGHFLHYLKVIRLFICGVCSKSIIVAQAGTAVSTRYRGETNAYNLIMIDQNRVSIIVRCWDGKRPVDTTNTIYVRSKLYWQQK